MPSMNVQVPELVEQIENGKLKQMVVRGSDYQMDEPIYIHENIFSGNRRKLRTTHCDGALGIEVVGGNKTVILNNRLLAKDEKEELAKNCGFGNFEAFIECYRINVGLPLKGQLVRWL